LRAVAAKRSVDDLAPDDPIAAEMTQIREALEEIRTRMAPRSVVPSKMREDLAALRRVFERNLGYLDEDDLDMLTTKKTSLEQDEWAAEIEKKWYSRQQHKAKVNDSRATGSPSGYSDERLL
jgi:predicted aldo/keto reductase-like oxidoreductase